jgi:hypothetical protein
MNRTIPIGQRVIDTRTIGKRHKYSDYEVICYSTGSGIYEYRALVYESNLPQNARIFFDTVKVRSYMPLNELLS